MNSSDRSPTSHHPNGSGETGPKLRDVLRTDIRRGDFFSTVRRDFEDLREYFLDDDQKNRMESMRPLKRGLFTVRWLLKMMILKLNPARRLILLIALVALILNFSVVGGDTSNITFDFNFGLLGGILILFILMLELKDKLLARSELEAGRAVQAELMPPSNPEVAGWSLWLSTRTANEVGGDLVDFQQLADQRCRIAIADVAGKGLNAALMSAKLQSTLRAVAADPVPLAAIVEKTNTIYYRDGIRSMFASLIYLEFRPDAGTVRYINAGHLPPVLLSDQQAVSRSKGNAAIGLLPEPGYREDAAELAPGDILVLFSDGLTEAKNPFGEFFGEQRLLGALPGLRNRSAGEIGAHLLRMVDQFIGDGRPGDDLSLVVMKRI